MKKIFLAIPLLLMITLSYAADKKIKVLGASDDYISILEGKDISLDGSLKTDTITEKTTDAGVTGLVEVGSTLSNMRLEGDASGTKDLASFLTIEELNNYEVTTDFTP